MGILKRATEFFSIPYVLGREIDRCLTRTQRLSRPVISVGNISSGGRGKTPVVQALARGLLERGYEPIVLTRGYGRKSRENLCLPRGELGVTLDAREVGDEALEIFSTGAATVLVGSNRARNAEEFLRQYPNLPHPVFVLDDGFQHWKLARDVDLVLVDPKDYRDALLPVGRLRERPGALKRASLVLELGRDFKKVSRLAARPAYPGATAIVTTRSGASEYIADLVREFPMAERIELKDHATQVEMLAAIRKSAARSLLVGPKEAVKLLPYHEFLAFRESGLTTIGYGERQWELCLVDIQIEWRDLAKIWAAIEQGLNGVERAAK